MVADVAIAGAGPAGAALAIELGRRGLRVALYEARFPRLKACGEACFRTGSPRSRRSLDCPAPRASEVSDS